MKPPKELYYGFIMFLGIAVYFLLMSALGLSHLVFLRLLNVVFVFYAVYKTIITNIKEGENHFLNNAVSGMTTSIIGVSLSIIGLLIYSYIRGGDDYVATLSKSFLFGGDPSVPVYCICLMFEGIASSVIVTMLVMLYTNSKYIAD